MRIFYHISMGHTPQELASLREVAIAALEQEHGKFGPKEFFKQVEWRWREVERRIQRAGLYRTEIASRLHIFIDGLANTEEEVVQKTIQELIALNIPAYRIAEKLQAMGAKIHGTEDLQLLLKERQFWAEVSQGKRPDPALAQQLLKGRDQATAQRINAVVPNGEFGLPFIGRAHNMIGELAKLTRNFKVIYL